MRKAKESQRSDSEASLHQQMVEAYQLANSLDKNLSFHAHEAKQWAKRVVHAESMLATLVDEVDIRIGERLLDVAVQRRDLERKRVDDIGKIAASIRDSANKLDHSLNQLKALEGAMSLTMEKDNQQDRGVNVDALLRSIRQSSHEARALLELKSSDPA